MIERDYLTNYLAHHLACDQFNDYAPNGLQVEGCVQIKRICTAVSASEACIQEAIAWGADALLVHHGYFWKGEPMVITGMKKRRITQLLTHNINLYAYHLPLDAHLYWGNNACLARGLGVFNVTQHTINKIPNILWSGYLPEPIAAEVLSTQLTTYLKRKPLHIQGNHQPIQHVAWCSGAAQDFIFEASSLKVDAYLSGEISERTFDQAHELGIHYFSCGHYATEMSGIQQLGEHLKAKFSLEHMFISSDNPV